MPPLHDSEFCWAHDPRYEAEAAEARRAGGQVKKREATYALLYDLNGIGSAPDIRRWIEFVMFESLSLGNSVPRNRMLLSGTQAATKLLETGELADRVEALEGIIKRQGSGPSAFDDEEDDFPVTE